MTVTVGVRGMQLGLALGACLVMGCGAQNPKMQIPNATGTSKAAGTAATSSKPIGDAGKTSTTGQPGSGTGGQAAATDPARISKANYDKIKIEMTQKDVCDILGAPTSDKPTGDGEGRLLTWEAGGKRISATFRQDRLKVIDSVNLDSDK